MQKLLLAAVLFAAAISVVSAQDSGEDTNGDGLADRWVSINGGYVSDISLDRNYDGEVDYIISYNESAEKTKEVLDFNYDGEMDDYYFYARGKMKRREIDTNYDGKIDIWVYLDGIYIMKYEKDTDFDGKIDVTEDYSGE